MGAYTEEEILANGSSFSHDLVKSSFEHSLNKLEIQLAMEVWFHQIKCADEKYYTVIEP